MNSKPKNTRRFLCALLAVLMMAAPMASCTSGGGNDDSTAETTAEVTQSVTATPTDEATETPTETPTEEVAEAETEAPDLSLKLVVDGASEYVIDFDSDTAKIPAYTFREVVAKATGVTLKMDQSDICSPTGFEFSVNFADGEAAALGNYGYEMTVSGNHLIVKAATLSGYDNAITRLMSDCTVGQILKVPADYAVTETLNWTVDYVLEGDDFKAEYVDGMFYNDKNDSVAYVSNAMWHMFGLIDDGQNLVYRFGNEPTWYEWMSEKMMWSGNTSYINDLKGRLRSFPQVSTGYMWSWGSFPYWQVGDCYSIHYDGTFRYIAAVYDVVSWEGNTDFLYEVDGDTAGGQYSSVDASKGRTVLDKTEACMSYILDYLHGKEGYILLTEESTYLNADGSERFDYVKDTGAYCWNNTGKDGSNASNYWDNLCFGGYDGYSNALFYNALQSMAGIYRMLGGEYIAKAEALEALSIVVKEKFNEMYWSEETGRYIACIDSDGRRVDYGLTFHNFEIMKYGLADVEKAKSIFDWIDGDRIIEGEERTGTAILSYGQNIQKAINRRKLKDLEDRGLRLAAVTNTIPINNNENRKLGIAWWHGPEGINVWGSAAYGYHLENGGYIFYPVFYELMARTEYEGAQSTTDRLADIAKVYEYNRLVSDLAASGSTNWLEGLNGEFPESGLVPSTYIYSLVGVTAEYDGLHLSPAFNDVYEYMGVREVKYNGLRYDVKVNRDGSCNLTATDGAADMVLHYTPERFGNMDFTVTVTTADGATTSTTVTPENGVICVELKYESVATITISPILA